MKSIELKGTPHQMGLFFGEECREQIAEFYALRRDNAIRRAKELGGQTVDEADLLAVAAACIEPSKRYHPRGFDELRGIAAGAKMSVEEIIAMNGLTDLRDVLTWPAPPGSLDECTAFIAQKNLTGGLGVLCGQTWDLATDNLPFMVLVRRTPDVGPRTASLTTMGCLSLIGMNSAGVCIGNTNISTSDSRPGVMYLSTIHKALSCERFEDAVSAVTSSPRVGAHYFYLASRGGEAVALECSATTHARQDIVEGAYSHTNHCLVPANKNIETRIPSESTLTRVGRMMSLMLDAPTVDVSLLKAALADEHGRADGVAICVNDRDGLNTNGAAILDPERLEMWVCEGNPTPGGWEKISLGV